MATFSIITTAAHDRAVQIETLRRNKMRKREEGEVTAAEVAQEIAMVGFDRLVARLKSEAAAIYDRLSKEDKEVVDAIYARYR